MRTRTITLDGTDVRVPTAVLPDRTPDSGPYCAATDPNGDYACTLPSGHATYAPHIAGTGTFVAAIWWDTHPPRQQPSA
jgi:hypothetical protein